jgi:hypothetical protein
VLALAHVREHEQQPPVLVEACGPKVEGAGPAARQHRTPDPRGGCLSGTCTREQIPDAAALEEVAREHLIETPPRSRRRSDAERADELGVHREEPLTRIEHRESRRDRADDRLVQLLETLEALLRGASLAADAGGGVYIDITPRLGLKADASVGYNYSFLNWAGGYTGSGPTSGGSLHYAGGLGVWYLVSPSLNVGLRIGYGSCLGLTSGLSVALGTSYYFTGREARLQRIEQGLPGRPDYLRAARTPNPDEGIRMSDITIPEVFPVFHKYYDDHPIGTAVRFNQERRPITDITLTVYLKQYMDAPKECRAPKELKAGESVKVDLFGLFTDKVLGQSLVQKADRE